MLETKTKISAATKLKLGLGLGLTGAALSAALGITSIVGRNMATNTPALPYNFVVIMTDDQRWDTLTPQFMPKTWDLLVSRGVNFTNAFMTTPFCCPARASILSGGFLVQDTQVLDNKPPNGGVQKFKDDASLAVALQAAGYKTGLIGKYLNSYSLIAPYIPPGWSRFVGWSNQTDWYNYKYAIGSSTPTASSSGTIVDHTNQYLINDQRDQALAFVNDFGDQPFFLYYATDSPHEPAKPAPEDLNLFNDYLYRGSSYKEVDLSDKPAIIRARAPKYNEIIEDKIHRNQLRSIQAVDRAVEEIVNAVAARGALDRTVFIFLSDNGVMWGEHGLKDKELPYEEVVRVPFVIRMPNVSPRSEANLVAVNLDLPATLYALAGLTKPTQGSNLASLMLDSGQSSSWRKELFFEAFRIIDGPLHRTWTTLRSARWKYTEWGTGERELYDLAEDPYELQSLHLATGSQYKSVRDDMQRRLNLKKGLSITTERLPRGSVGAAYSFQLAAWGGKAPYSWSIATGRLPAGLSLSSNGTISGTPTAAGTRRVFFKATDQSLTAYAGTPQSFVQDFAFNILNQGEETDLIPPEISFVLPADNSVLSGIVELEANVTDNSEVDGVEFVSQPIGRIGIENAVPPYIKSWDTTTLPDGLYTISAVARDAAGNRATASRNFIVKNAPDPTEPSVTIITPRGGASVSGSIALSASVTGGEATGGVRFFVDNNLIGSGNTAVSYTVSWNTKLVANGLHILIAKVKSASGKEVVSPPVTVAVRNVTVDVSPPIISSVVVKNAGIFDAVIDWITNESADTQLEYGLTTSYGNQTSLNLALIKYHSVAMADLTPNTTYHYRVKSKDAVGNVAMSGDNTFQTAVMPIATSFLWFNRTWEPVYVMFDGIGDFGNWSVDRSGRTPILDQNTIGDSHFRVVAVSANRYRNYEIETLVSLRSGVSVGLCGRMDDNGNGYCLRVTPDEIPTAVISKFIDRALGPEDLAKGAPVAMEQNRSYVMKLRFNENTIWGKIYPSGTVEPDWQVTAVDTSFARGKVGLYSHNSQPRFWRITVRGLTEMAAGVTP